MVIILVTITGYSINGYWWLLVFINGCYINDYCGYFIDGY